MSLWNTPLGRLSPDACPGMGPGRKPETGSSVSLVASVTPSTEIGSAWSLGWLATPWTNLIASVELVVAATGTSVPGIV
ncbi:MAG: hypothetical protein ACKOCJ_09275 [Burkholderiaceae bacterium]